jgi:hypothetical protein
LASRSGTGFTLLWVKDNLGLPGLHPFVHGILALVDMLAGIMPEGVPEQIAGFLQLSNLVPKALDLNPEPVNLAGLGYQLVLPVGISDSVVDEFVQIEWLLHRFALFFTWGSLRPQRRAA